MLLNSIHGRPLGGLPINNKAQLTLEAIGVTKTPSPTQLFKACD
jgi:hypothetical protein